MVTFKYEEQATIFEVQGQTKGKQKREFLWRIRRGGKGEENKERKIRRGDGHLAHCMNAL